MSTATKPLLACASRGISVLLPAPGAPAIRRRGVPDWSIGRGLHAARTKSLSLTCRVNNLFRATPRASLKAFHNHEEFCDAYVIYIRTHRLRPGGSARRPAGHPDPRRRRRSADVGRTLGGAYRGA